MTTLSSTIAELPPATGPQNVSYARSLDQAFDSAGLPAGGNPSMRAPARPKGVDPEAREASVAGRRRSVRDTPPTPRPLVSLDRGSRGRTRQTGVNRRRCRERRPGRPGSTASHAPAGLPDWQIPSPAQLIVRPPGPEHCQSINRPARTRLVRSQFGRCQRACAPGARGRPLDRSSRRNLLALVRPDGPTTPRVAVVAVGRRVESTSR